MTRGACLTWVTSRGHSGLQASQVKVNQIQAYVLHTRPYRETSLLVELFTREHGRVTLVANGVRGRKNSTPPRQFVACLVSWVGRGPLFTLTDCELAPSMGLVGDRLACGFYANELLMRMTQPLDVHDYLYEIYADTVEALAGLGSMSIVLRKFESALLKECGYLPDFTCNGETGEPLEPDACYELQLERGFVLSRKSAGDSVWFGATLTSIYVGDFRARLVRDAARQVFQAALRPHLGDRPLASRELLRPLSSSRASRS